MMAKINGKNIDPKAYAARVTQAKKTVAKMDPTVKAKLKEYYPKITKKDIAKQMIGPSTSLSDLEKRIKANPKATPKVAMNSTPKVTAKAKPKATPKVAMNSTPKVTAKAKPKATPKVAMNSTPLTKSEKDFNAGQKMKAKITKKTGVYPNTAN
jgi:hypothetical protein